METPSTRRKFIATLGAAGTIALAGCSYIPGGDNPSSNTSTTTDGTSTGTQTKTSATKIKNTTDNKNKDKKSSALGTSVDDFEGDVGSRWGIEFGKYTTTNQDAFQGTQSLVLEPKKPGKEPVAKISKYFNPKALDLSKHDLSLAVKVNKPKTIRVKAEVIAPAESSKLTAVRHIPLEQDGWVRFDLGYTDVTGNPAMDKVTQVNIQIGPLLEANNFQVLIDDLRKIPKPSKGKVMFQFDDADITAYEQAFPVLKENGWPGSVAVVPDVINGEDRLKDKMMREMGKAGWDMMGHAGTILPTVKKQEQRRILQDVKQYLELMGYKKGARHFVAPSSRVDATSLSLIDELYETGFLFGGCPNNAQHPSNPNFISRVQGPSVRGVRRVLDVAEQTNQLVVISYHRIEHGENNVPMSRFREVIDHVKKKDMDVITPSQLIDGKNW